MNTITSIFEYLQKHPVIGFVSPLLSAVLIDIHQLEATFRFAGVLIGFLVGVITLILKVMEYRQKTKSKQKQ